MANWLLNKPDDLFISSFFACKEFVIKEIIKYNNPYPYMQGLALRTTNNIVNVDIDHKERTNGRKYKAVIII